MPSADSPRGRVLAIPFLIGVVLRLLGLTRQPLWIDEIITLDGASVGSPFRWADVLGNPQGPLPQVLLRGWIAVGGDSDLWLRLWAALTGILALAVGIAVLRRIAPRAAEAGAWLLALSPFAVWYSQEVRNYVFVLLFAPLVLQSFLVWRKNPGPRPGLLHAASLVGLMLSNLSGLFLLPALGVHLLLRDRRRFMPWIALAAVALLAVSPWIRTELTDHVEWSGVMGAAPAGEPIRGGEGFRPGSIPFTGVVFLGGFGAAPPLRAIHAGLDAEHWLAVLPVLGLLAVGAVLALAGLRREADRDLVLLLTLWCVVPVALAVLVAVAGLKAYNPRYVTVVQPILLMLVALGAVQGRGWRRGVMLLLLLGMFGGWVRQTFEPAYAREDNRSVAAALSRRAGPGDVILEQGVQGVLARYYDGEARIVPWYPLYQRDADGGRARLAAILADRDRVFWVGSRLWYDDPQGRLLDALALWGDPRPTGPPATGVDLRLYARKPR